MKTAKSFFAKYDLKAILHGQTMPLFYWILQVVAVYLFHYPGIICMTPLAWLLAFTAGRDCTLHSLSPLKQTRLVEASLSGALLGFIQGLLFILVTTFSFPLAPDEIWNAVLLDAGVLLIGIAVCTGLAWIASQRYTRTFYPHPGFSLRTQNTVDQDNTTPCPICSRPHPLNPRYPNAVCTDCTKRAVDKENRRLEFYNEDLSGGLKIVYADTGEIRTDPTCYIDGIRCRAAEAHMGGIVITPES